MNHKNIIAKLTLEEKIAMIHAAGLFRSGAVKQLNIPSLVMSDGQAESVRNLKMTVGRQLMIQRIL